MNELLLTVAEAFGVILMLVAIGVIMLTCLRAFLGPMFKSRPSEVEIIDQNDLL